jgi:AP-1 complex subunit mu
MSYRLTTNVKPLIIIESNIERHSHSRVEYTIKVRGVCFHFVSMVMFMPFSVSQIACPHLRSSP